MTLREAREKNNLSQTQLAKKLNIHKSTVTKWESGVSKPRYDTFKLIADVFSTPTEEVFNWFK